MKHQKERELVKPNQPIKVEQPILRQYRQIKPSIDIDGLKIDKGHIEKLKDKYLKRK